MEKSRTLITMKMPEEADFAENPILSFNPYSFCMEIEKVVKENQLDYLDAVCWICENQGLDFSAVPKLLTPTMKDKIEVAATERRFKLG